MGRNESFRVNECNPLEVLYCINGRPRRFAICTHEQDAKDIVEALQKQHTPCPPIGEVKPSEGGNIVSEKWTLDSHGNILCGKKGGANRIRQVMNYHNQVVDELEQEIERQRLIAADTHYHEIANELGLLAGVYIAPEILPAIQKLKSQLQMYDMNIPFYNCLAQEVEEALGPHPKWDNGMWIERIKELRSRCQP